MKDQAEIKSAEPREPVSTRRLHKMHKGITYLLPQMLRCMTEINGELKKNGFVYNPTDAEPPTKKRAVDTAVDQDRPALSPSPAGVN